MCDVSRDSSRGPKGDLVDAKEESANFSLRDLILFFRHQLRVKIRCDRKRLDRITFDKRWVHTAKLVVRKGATLESSFSPFLAHSWDELGFRDPNPSKLSFISPFFPPVSRCHWPCHLSLSFQNLPVFHFFYFLSILSPLYSNPTFWKDLGLFFPCCTTLFFSVPCPTYSF